MSLDQALKRLELSIKVKHNRWSVVGGLIRCVVRETPGQNLEGKEQQVSNVPARKIKSHPLPEQRERLGLGEAGGGNIDTDTRTDRR